MNKSKVLNLLLILTLVCILLSSVLMAGCSTKEPDYTMEHTVTPIESTRYPECNTKFIITTPFNKNIISVTATVEYRLYKKVYNNGYFEEYTSLVEKEYVFNIDNTASKSDYLSEDKKDFEFTTTQYFADTKDAEITLISIQFETSRSHVYPVVIGILAAVILAGVVALFITLKLIEKRKTAPNNSSDIEDDALNK